MEEGSFTAGKRKRNLGKKKGTKAKNKKLKMLEGKGKKFRVSKKMRNLFEKRARDYNSDDEEEEEKEDTAEEAVPHDTRRGRGGDISFEGSDDSEGEEQEGGEIQPGIISLLISSHTNFVFLCVAGHFSGEVIQCSKISLLKYLILSVNKAQKAQKGLDPSRSKDAKVIRKRRKEAFFSELGKTSLPARDSSSKGNTSDSRNDEGPAWAPLRDNYMLTNPKLKDWDKMADSAIVDDVGMMSEDSGSDDD
ncbi:hypothetical protein ES332_D11G167700v1 [Gossypium tomentosum]|uniref:RRP15-like protein n=1 Tax=Gossypium tomentosum TaxID=34277 RepID=A0A5D2IP29_GOSTO|nr:hypothetical protein ES332_D11G167700v1 [Gossypium tomentosum]